MAGMESDRADAGWSIVEPGGGLRGRPRLLYDRRAMKWVALATWIVAALTGGALFNAWLSGGGMEQAKRSGRRIRPWLILTHLGLAVLGLVIWIVYVATDDQGLNWLAFLVLLPVALLGWWMFVIWLLRRRRGQPERASRHEDASDAPAEQRFPVWLVAVHGLFAVATVILVLVESAAGES
jgi:manganese efflux pump family protein